MKIKIEADTRDWTQTKILIDGKPMQNDIKYFYLSIEAGELIVWGMGFRKKFDPFKKVRHLFWKFRWKLFRRKW